MTITDLELDGLKLITPKVFTDSRGFFCESYSKKWLPDIEFVQSNHALSIFGTIRGFHYQAVTPTCPGQAKLIRATKGKIIDVAIDIRKNSQQLGKWVAMELSESNFRQLFMPVGFAHGYIALSDVVEVQYMCSNFYDSTTESGIMWNDPDIGVIWPNVASPLISVRDHNNQSFREYAARL